MISKDEFAKSSITVSEASGKSLKFSVPLRYANATVSILILWDVFIVWIALALGVCTRLALGPLFPAKIGLSQYEGLFLASFLVPFVHLVNGVYPGFGLAGVERTRLYVVGTLVVFAIFIGSEYVAFREGWSRGVFLLSLGFALVLSPLGSAFIREALGRAGLWGAPVVILGATKTGVELARKLKEQKALGLRPIAFLDDDSTKRGNRIEDIPVVGGLDQASKLARMGVRHAILTMPEGPKERIAQIVENSPFRYTIVIPNLFGVTSLWVSGRDLGGILGLELRRNLLFRRNRLIKRTMDYLAGIPLLLAGLPLIAFFAIWIKRTSPGPAFFTQEREGKNGKVIRIVKLRTMYIDAEQRLEAHLKSNPEARKEWENYFKLKDDPRILPKVGYILRKTSLDELPQLWNVLKGDMSLVGPRPFPFYHLEAFPPAFRELRRSVLPGLTGLWQVSARSEGDLSVQEQLDTYYIRNWSVWLDLHILAKTFWVVIKGKGAY